MSNEKAHEEAVRRMRELAEDMDNWPDEDNHSASLTFVCDMADWAPVLRDALTNLANEAEASAEMARECIGNTNTHCLLTRIAEARAALSQEPKP